MGGILLHYYLFERFLGDCGGENGLDEGYPLVRLHRDGAFQPGVYYLPQHFGHNVAMALVPAIALGIFVAAFVPMAAVFPALEPNHKGAAISVYNLSAGLSNFLAPAIAVVLLPYFSTIGVVIAYTALYILAFFLCPLIRVEQPGFTSDQHAKPFTANAAES